ncbi:MAG: murein L,D-transpeptidase catalytic domain family protein [Pseudomonadota bacterium]
MRLSRRSFLQASLTAAAAGSIAPAFAKAAPAGNSDIAAVAARVLARNASRVSHSDIVGIVDFAAPSWKARLHLVDMIDGKASSFLTAHGRGSDPAHSGWLQSFSNEPGSNATSKGAYLTGGEYQGKYGRSMRLTGLDPDNSNAEARAIVIHPAWYVSEGMLEKYGKLGRSEGCFALCAEDLAGVIDRLGPGRLLYVGKFAELAG